MDTEYSQSGVGRIGLRTLVIWSILMNDCVPLLDVGLIGLRSIVNAEKRLCSVVGRLWKVFVPTAYLSIYSIPERIVHFNT